MKGKNIKSKNNLKKYKKAIISYECPECNFSDYFEEDLKSQISRIKSDSCSHFSFKFIYNLEDESFKYIISFNCNNCGANHMINLLDKNIVDNEIKINYKCQQCGNGSLFVGLMLIEESNLDEEVQSEKLFNDNKDKEKKNNKIYKTSDGNQNNNDEKIKIFNFKDNKNQEVNAKYGAKIYDQVISSPFFLTKMPN